MGKKKKAASNTLEVQNAAKTMLANIRFASVDNPMQSIVLTSAVPNEGKTTTTIELAKVIACCWLKQTCVAEAQQLP